MLRCASLRIQLLYYAIVRGMRHRIERAASHYGAVISVSVACNTAQKIVFLSSTWEEISQMSNLRVWKVAELTLFIFQSYLVTIY